ncbi:MAG: ergothioneine biosynthesis protein EgtC [Salinisphaera sp.]|jgi:glutamine amidotransferase|nr:ergothioneine biosynthesis protein EgtC [Salinisphaera sp.]
MCRIAAYRGPDITLADFLSTPPHSLARQSWDAREMASATVNADGWGAGWYAADGDPAVYRNTLPIWADGNTDALGRSLQAPLWMANVRSATPGLGTDHANTQPFAGNGLIFLHNGYIENFAQTLRAPMRADIDPAIEATIMGNTDSEYLFALLRSMPGSLEDKLAATVDQTMALLLAHGKAKALLNMIVTDGQHLAYVRSAYNTAAPSLYIHPCWQSATVVASEPFDNDGGWQPIEPDRPAVV